MNAVSSAPLRRMGARQSNVWHQNRPQGAGRSRLSDQGHRIGTKGPSSMLARKCCGAKMGFQKLLVSGPGADRLVRKGSFSGHSVALLPQKTYVSPPKKCMYRCKKRGRHDATPAFTSKNNHKVVCMAASHLAVRRIGGKRRGVTLRAGLVTRE